MSKARLDRIRENQKAVIQPDPTTDFLLTEIDALREALQFYAETWTWGRVRADVLAEGADGLKSLSKVYAEKARKALGEDK